MLTFTQITEQDKDYFLKLNNEADVLYNMESDREYKSEDFTAIINYPLVVWYIIKDGTKRIGLFTVYTKLGKLFFGIIIDKRYRGNGYGRKALEKFLLMTDSANEEVNLCCFKDNERATKIYYSLGFEETGLKVIIRGREFVYMKRKAR